MFMKFDFQMIQDVLSLINSGLSDDIFDIN